MAGSVLFRGLLVSALALLTVAEAAAQATVPTAAPAVTPAPTGIRRGETVLTRPRPELDPLGVRAGSFLFFPQMLLSGTYNDNIFADSDNEEDDFITNLTPQLLARSDWSRHALNVRTGLDAGLHAHNQNENYLDYNAGIDGRVDITADSFVAGGLGYLHNHVSRDDPDDAGGRNPTEVDNYDALLRYNQRMGRFQGTVDGTFLRQDYHDEGDINEDDRDRNVFTGGLRLGYEVQPQYEAFVRFGANRRVYDETPDDVGQNRDSYGGEAVVGVALDLGGLVFGDVYVGWVGQRYKDGLDDVDAATFGGSLAWNVTTLTTITGRVTRTVNETTENGASSYLATTGRLDVDHELLRNLLLNANVSVSESDYEGISREDYIVGAGIGARYLLNRHLYATLGYRFQDRTAENSPDDFSQNLVTIGVQGQF